MAYAQCAKQPACLGLNTERPVHRTGPALFMPWSDAPGLSAHTLVVRSVGQESGRRISPQWGVVHEHTRRPTPVFMNTKMFNSNFHRPTWACGGRPPAPKQHTPTFVDGAFDGRPLQHRESRFGLLTPNSPFFMNKQRRLLCALVARASATTGTTAAASTRRAGLRLVLQHMRRLRHRLGHRRDHPFSNPFPTAGETDEGDLSEITRFLLQ